MPKSKRAKVFHLTQVKKKTREHKDALFTNIRECIPNYQYCFVFNVDNMRNNYLKDVRRELGDCRLFFGKTKLTARALGTTPEDAQAQGIDGLAPYLRGSVGLVFANRDPAALLAYFASRPADVDFARAGAHAARTVTVPPGVLYATGGQVADDVPMAHSLEPELRRLGMPVRLVKGRVMLDKALDGGDQEAGGLEEDTEQDGGGYTICREGQVLDSRQTRLLKLFSICLSEFQVKPLAYWTAATGEVTRIEGDAMDVEGAEEDSDEE